MAQDMEGSVWQALDQFKIELPSWGFANTGTRFGKFMQPAAATNLAEKFNVIFSLRPAPRFCASAKNFPTRTSPCSRRKSWRTCGKTIPRLTRRFLSRPARMFLPSPKNCAGGAGLPGTPVPPALTSRSCCPIHPARPWKSGLREFRNASVTPVPGGIFF